MALAEVTFGEITTWAHDFQYLYNNPLVQNKNFDSFSIKLYCVVFLDRNVPISLWKEG